jgi:hypothetical protein
MVLRANMNIVKVQLPDGAEAARLVWSQVAKIALSAVSICHISI